MVSQFGSLGYTIMGKTADLTVDQKKIIDTLHKVGKPQTFIAKEAGCSHMTLFHCMVRHGTVRYSSLLGGFPLGTVPGT